MGLTNVLCLCQFRYSATNSCDLSPIPLYCRREAELDFSRWSEDAPDDYLGDEDCVQFLPSGTWNDFRCSHRAPYVCKKGKEEEEEGPLYSNIGPWSVHISKCWHINHCGCVDGEYLSPSNYEPLSWLGTFATRE